MAALCVLNKKGDVVIDDLTADKFVSFKKRCGAGSAVIVEMEGDLVLVDTCKIFRGIPPGALYKARLVRSTKKPPEEIAHAGYDAWVEV